MSHPHPGSAPKLRDCLASLGEETEVLGDEVIYQGPLSWLLTDVVPRAGNSQL